jgi:hypothetical protein
LAFEPIIIITPGWSQGRAPLSRGRRDAVVSEVKLARAAMRKAEGPEPAKGAQVVVDLIHEPAVAAAALGGSGAIGCASPFRPAAVEHDVDRGVARERALDVLVELLSVTLDDHDLLDALIIAPTLGAFCPALREGMELGQDLQGALVEELGEQHPGISATRGA